MAVCCLMAEQFLVAVWLMASKATSVGQTYDNHVYLINIYIYIYIYIYIATCTIHIQYVCMQSRCVENQR